MKYRRILVLFTITLLSAVLTTGTLTAANFADQSSVSAQKQSNEVFVDPFLQEVSSAKHTGVLERFIVMFNPTVGIGLRKQLLSTIEGVEIIQAYKVIPGVCISAPLGATESIKKLKGVEAIWLDHKVEALKSSSQIVFGHGVSPMLSDSARLINASSLWALGINGSGIVIAVVDTGINWNHTSLDDLDDVPATVDPKVIANVSFVPGVPTGFDDDGHGTHVAGIAAGTGGPSQTYMGVAPGAQLYAVKVLDSTGSGQWSWVVAGIEWSVENDADIITMSLGGSGYPYDPVSMASDAAVDAGVVVTVAAGNDPNYGAILSPGLATKVITVGATTKDDAIASFSSKGPNTHDYRGDPDVVAPGVGIMSADAWDITGYVAMSGTSMATPHVAGGAALLLQAFVNATPNLVASALMASAVDIGYDSYTQGAGRIDVLGAYNLITESRRQGTLSLSPKTSLQPNSPRTLQEKVSPQYIWFRNSRIEFYVDDFGNIFSLYFDGRDVMGLFGAMAWRIAYNTSNLASWFDLEVIQPVSMRVSNETYQQAFGALRTPDRAVAIFVMVELFGNETWARTSFMVWPMGVALENLRIFYIEDVGMNLDYGNDWSYYYSSQDIIVVNDTLEAPPAQHFGFGGSLRSSAHHVGEYPSGFEVAYYDQLNNETEWIGDDNNAFRWSLGTVNTQTNISVIFGLEYNVSATFSAINTGRATPKMPFDITLYPELSVSISGPTMVEPDTPATYKATVSNPWIGDSTNATLTFYLDDTIVNSTVINLPSGASVEAPINVTTSMGMHFIKAEIYDPSDPMPENNFARRKKVFAGIMFSAVLPCELEVYTYNGFGPFANYPTAWVNLTIITPALMPDVEIRLTGNLSQVISFVNSPNVGDIEGWAYPAFEVYTSGDPFKNYTGFIEVLSAGLVVNKLPVRVNVGWNPVPKINSVSLNDTSVLRLTETLGVTINVTDLDSLSQITPPSNISVNVYLLYFDPEGMRWIIMEGPISAPYNVTTGLFEFEYVFPADFSLGMFGIGVEASDPQGDIVLAMPRKFHVENNVPVISATVSPRNIVGNETVSINVTASDVETPIEQLEVTGTMVPPTGEEIPVRLTLANGMLTATFNDTSEEGVYIFFAMVTDGDGTSRVSIGFFEVDDTLPSVEILSPMDGTVVSGIVNVTFVAWDTKLVNASLIIDSSAPIDITSITLFTLNTTVLSHGPHTIKLMAFDLAGNEAETSITITVDNTAPTATFISPADGSLVAGTVNVTFSLSDANLEKATLLLDGKILSEVTNNTFHLWNTTRVADGEHTLTLIVVDKAGKSKTIERTVAVDNTLAIVEIREPIENAYLRDTHNISVYVYEANLIMMELYIDGFSVKNWTESGLQTYLWNTATVTDDSHSISLIVYDRGGNAFEKNVTVTVDNTAPVVGITDPAEGAKLKGTVTINFVAADNAILYVDNSVFNVTGETSYEWDTSKVGDGSHIIKLVAYDKAGNSATTEITVTTINVRSEIEATRNLYLSIGIPLGLVVGAIIAYAISRRRPRARS